MAARDNVELTMRVQWRDPLGRFAERIQEAGEDSAYDLAKRGAKLSRNYAPKKTRSLMKAIKAEKGLRGLARWTVVGDDKLLTIAASQEGGSRPHRIKSHDGGPLANKEERFFARSGEVRHPGTDAIHFMKRARQELAAVAVTITRSHMPRGRG